MTLNHEEHKYMRLAIIMAYNLYKGDIEDAAKWITTRHDLLFGNTPLEIIVRGDGLKLVDWLIDRSGKTKVGGA